MTIQKAKPVTTMTGTAPDFAAIKYKLTRIEGVVHDISTILKPGGIRDRDTLLNMLVWAVIPAEGKSMADRMRARQKELRSIAMQVRTVVRHAEHLALDSGSYVHFYSPFRSEAFESYKKQMTKRLASRWPFEGMLDCADWADKEAGKFGRLLRTNSQRERRVGVLGLLHWVHLRTGKLSKKNLQALARLLTDASEAAGGTKTFTASQLRKDFRRHVLPTSASF